MEGKGRKYRRSERTAEVVVGTEPSAPAERARGPPVWLIGF